MPAEAPYPVQLAINQWWNRWGFSDNPFARAVSEEQFFPHFFVDAGKFEWIYGDPQKPCTVLFFAGRGCGKTAHRLKLENDSAPIRTDAAILSIVYTKFEAWNQENGLLAPESHLKLILREGLEAIFKTISALSGSQIKNLPGTFYGLLKPLAERYFPESLRRLERGLNLLWWRTAVDHEAFTAFQTKLKDETLIPYADSTAFHHMQEFVEITQILGFEAVYVLVDAVDEVQLPPSLTWMDCLESLLSNLHLMRMPGLAFKFFLPAEKMDEFLSKQFVRKDKLEYAELQWNTQDLMALLRNRLRAFNGSGVDSMRMMCEPKLAGMIDSKLVENSYMVPRNLIYLARYLIQTHCSLQDWKGLIKFSEWEQALQELEKSHELIRPTARMDPLVIGKNLVMIGQKEVKLSQNEYKFLWGVAQNSGRFTKQELVEHVYGAGQGVSDDSISGLIKRLRDKLGDSSENPKYIFTVHGTGFELKNWQLEGN